MPARSLWLQPSGRLEAVVAIADLQAMTAAALLPAGLELLPQTAAPAGRHPLVLLLGEHSRVGLQGLPCGLRYRELALALPFVRPRAGPRGPFCHLPLLLLDRALPTWLGRWIYGFAKRRALIRRTADSFEAIDRTDWAPLLSVRIRRLAAAVDLGPARSLLEQPLINRGRGARWRYARFDFGLERARLAAAEADIVVHPELAGGLPAGPLRVERAIRLDIAWTLRRLRPREVGVNDCAGSRPDPRTGRS